MTLASHSFFYIVLLASRRIQTLLFSPKEVRLSSKVIIMFYSVKDVADILRLSEPTILRLIRDGEIRAVKLGKRVFRVHESTIEALIDSALVGSGGSKDGTN